MIKNKQYINGIQYHLQISGEGRDGTWFDGIGSHGGGLVVNTLCRGNYVCDTVWEVHSLQNLYYWLKREELPIKASE